jgi:WD40 repeat protein
LTGCLDGGGGVRWDPERWDAATGRSLGAVLRHGRDFKAVAFSPDGRRLATASWDATVWVWDAATGRQTLTLRRHGVTGGELLSLELENVVPSMVFSLDGRRLASASEENTVTVWDAATGRELLCVKGHLGKVRGVPQSWQTFSPKVALGPSGQRLAIASEDGTVKVWDVATGRELLCLEGHTGAILGMTFSPDGQRLATASRDQTVRVWDTTIGPLQQSFKATE